MAKKTRRSYLDNYQRGMNGEYYYTGRFMTFEGTSEQRSGYRRLLIIISAVTAVLFIVSGLFDEKVLWNTFYVLIPFAAEAVCLAIMIYKIIRFLFQKEPVKEYVFKQTVPVFMGLAMAAGIAAIVEAIACIVYISINDNAVIRVCIFFIIIKVITAVLLILFNRFFKKLSWKAE